MNEKNTLLEVIETSLLNREKTDIEKVEIY